MPSPVIYSFKDVDLYEINNKSQSISVVLLPLQAKPPFTATFSTQWKRDRCDIRWARPPLSTAFGWLMRQNIWPVLIRLFYYVSRQLQNPFRSQTPVALVLKRAACPVLRRIINHSLNGRKGPGNRTASFSTWTMDA